MLQTGGARAIFIFSIFQKKNNNKAVNILGLYEQQAFSRCDHNHNFG